MEEVLKVENNVPQNNPVQYYAKVPYTQTDEFGTTATLYRKEYFTVENYQAEIAKMQARLDAVANLA